MNSPEKKARMHQLHLKVRASSQQIKRIKKHLDKAIERRGVQVDDALHQDLSTTLADSSSDILSQHPPGSFARIFWEQQEQASKLKNAKSMRWEPAMIRLVHFFKHNSNTLVNII